MDRNLELAEAHFLSPYPAVKRTFDIVVSLTGLVALLPFGAVVSIAIVLLTGDAPLFRHTRVGKSGRRFSCWKFRTMRAAPLDRNDGEPDPFALHAKLADRDRITGIGHWLRRSSLDELPQLWNVLIGDMSIVGPRPVTPAEVQHIYGSDARALLSVRPGLTGLWQVSGRSLMSSAERVQCDLDYVRRASLILDLIIMARTPAAVVTARGAE